MTVDRFEGYCLFVQPHSFHGFFFCVHVSSIHCPSFKKKNKSFSEICIHSSSPQLSTGFPILESSCANNSLRFLDEGHSVLGRICRFGRNIDPIETLTQCKDHLWCLSVISSLEANITKLYCENVGFAVRPDNPTVGAIFQLMRKEEELRRGSNNSAGEHTHQSHSPHQPVWHHTNQSGSEHSCPDHITAH